MQPEIYQNYSDSIREALTNGQRRKKLKLSSNISSFDGLESNQSKFSLINENKDMSLFSSLQPLSSLSGMKVKYHEKPGAHPDFVYLKETNSFEYHYITSMFIDIKNSTGLFKNYEPATVAYITNTIQRAAIHTCWHFNGYIQRYHGDGLFVYFGGKNASLTESTVNAINSASFFSYFMQNDLKRIFLEQGVEDIYTRIGIDTGYENEVLWYLAGIKDCSEITTCSLHTSLAAKMQSNATSNGIMLGDTVKISSNLDNDLFSIKVKDGKEDRYIFQIPDENYNYTQWQFNWEKHLRSYSSLSNSKDSNIYLKPENKPIESNPNFNKEFLESKANGYKPYYRK